MEVAAVDNIRAENNALASRAEENEQLKLHTELFLQNCPDMIFLFDTQLNLIACSEACLPLLSRKERAALKDTPLKQIFSAHLEDGWVEKVYQQNSQVLSALSRLHFDDTIFFCGKPHMHAQVAISPAMDEGGVCRGTIMTISNTTELVETKRRAEEAASSKSSFLANMSHEIRTPMNAVKGLSELLSFTELNSLQRNYVKNIINSANSLLSIINDVLDFSKIDANKIEIIEGAYGLAGLVTGVCNIVSMRADDKDLALLIKASPNLPSTLYGDESRIKQVVTNLLSNAVKYTNEGYICLNVSAEERDGQLWLQCAVEDSGVGIREEDIPTLFKAFSRADLLTHRSVAGTGLGLAISKQLAVAMGGDIEVQSVYGKGSVFTFSIPQRAEDSMPIAQLEEAPGRQVLLLGTGKRIQNIIDMLTALNVPYTHIESSQKLLDAALAGYTHCICDSSFPERALRSLCGQMPDCLFAALKNMRHAMSVADYQDTILYLPVFITDIARFLNRNSKNVKNAPFSGAADEELILRDAKILVVDDNEINLIVSSEMLRSFEAQVLVAESGDEALRLCEEQKFDIIFMDHMMPGKDGIVTTQEIRAGQSINKESPIVALTANVVDDVESMYLRNGMDDFIGKPIEMTDISKVLRKWMPKEKLGLRGGALRLDGEAPGSELLSPEDLIAAFDNFGLYSSDVMREMNGDFEGYISRMDEVSKVLNALVSRLKDEVSDKRWDDFSRDCHKLHGLLYGIGARDCAGRARKLAIAGHEHNVGYIYEDFLSLMGNMYMLDKKLVVIVPFARGGNTQELPLGSAQYLHGCLEKMGRALNNSNAAEAMAQLENAAAFSLDMGLDMALKDIKADLEKGDFATAIEHHATIFRDYTERLACS